MLIYMVYKIMISDCLSSRDRVPLLSDELEESCGET